MLMHIVRKEILEHFMSLRFAVACVLCFTVVLAGLFVRQQEYLLVSADYHEERVSAAQERDNKRRPRGIVWRGVTTHQKPNPLKIFVRGVDEGNGVSVRVNAHRPPQILTDDTRNPLMLLFPAMGLVNFVGVLMSLLAIVFGYDAICGEKERGTLRLMLSYNVPRDHVLLGKWIGGYTALVAPFLLSILAGGALVLIQRQISLSLSQWARLGVVCAIAFLYIAVIYWMTIWVSCLTRRAATSVMVLVTIWLVAVLAIPNLSPYVARAIRPTQNPLQLEINREESRREIWERMVEDRMKKYREDHGFGDKWWKEIDWDKWEERRRFVEMQVYWNQNQKEANDARLRRYEQLDESFQRELDGQVRLSRWLSRSSPFSCFAMLAAELTDTGMMAKRRFLEQIRGYQHELADYGHAECLRVERYPLEHEGKGLDWRKPENRIGPIPVFTYVPAAGSDYLKEAVLDAGILAASAVIFFILSYLSFRRYDVR